MDLIGILKRAKWYLFQKPVVTWRAWKHQRALKFHKFPSVMGLGSHNSPQLGKALLTFIVEPFLAEFPQDLSRSHANYFKTTVIVDALIASGYSVDVFDWRTMHSPPADHYDIVIGQGNAFVHSCYGSRKEMPRVYLGWGLHATATRNAVKQRSVSLRRRRGLSIAESHPRDDGPKYATDILYLGNEHTKSTYSQYSIAETKCLRNPITLGVESTLASKDFVSARKRFLWMAAYGPLRRSLDVLLEVFAKNPDYELWICGDMSHERSFFRSYHTELHDVPNIKYIGWVDVAGMVYRNATQNCGYFIYPSVSDGMPGSVVNAMASGLVPIVTKEAGMECGGLDIPITAVDHSEIAAVIQRAGATPPAELKARSEAVVKFATEYYSRDAFKSHFGSALSRVLSRHGLRSLR
jgi:glycosyltransferase involved in cell wall biosynthesis